MGTLLNVAQEDTGSSLLILRIMVKIVKRASYLVHPIEMRHGELVEVIEWYNGFVTPGTVVIRIVNNLYVVGEASNSIPDNIVLNKSAKIRVRILKPGTVIEL